MLCGSRTIFIMSFSDIGIKELKSRFLVWPLVFLDDYHVSVSKAF